MKNPEINPEGIYQESSSSSSAPAGIEVTSLSVTPFSLSATEILEKTEKIELPSFRKILPLYKPIPQILIQGLKLNPNPVPNRLLTSLLEAPPKTAADWDENGAKTAQNCSVRRRAPWRPKTGAKAPDARFLQSGLGAKAPKNGAKAPIARVWGRQGAKNRRQSAVFSDFLCRIFLSLGALAPKSWRQGARKNFLIFAPAFCPFFILSDILLVHVSLSIKPCKNFNFISFFNKI